MYTHTCLHTYIHLYITTYVLKTNKHCSYYSLVELSASRPLKIFYCPPKPGDVWPPTSSQSSGGKLVRDGGSGGGGGGGVNNPPRRERSEKPLGCRKLFAGNLSYNIDDETMVDFFKDCGKLIGLRWLTHKDSGEFKVHSHIVHTYTLLRCIYIDT